LECSVGVENVDDIIEKVKNNGGQLLMPKTAIPYVSWLAKIFGHRRQLNLYNAI
jgi:predicted enzyme related to lactoylglutathione lyase